MRKIDFANPKQVMPITSEDRFDERICYIFNNGNISKYSPLTPLFVCEIQIETHQVKVTIINNFSGRDEKTEPYIIRL